MTVIDLSNYVLVTHRIDTCGEYRATGRRGWWVEDELKRRVRQLHPHSVRVVLTGRRYKMKYNIASGAVEFVKVSRGC